MPPRNDDFEQSLDENFLEKSFLIDEIITFNGTRLNEANVMLELNSQRIKNSSPSFKSLQ